MSMEWSKLDLRKSLDLKKEGCHLCEIMKSITNRVDNLTYPASLYF